MRCAFGNCRQEHDLLVKIHPDSGVVPMCKGCAETESEKYHVSFQNSRKTGEVPDYVVAYDPDEALAEQLIDATQQIEQALSQYEGDSHQQIETVTEARDEIEKVITEL